MKTCTIINTVDADVRTVTASGLKHYMRKYEQQAREMLKRTQMKHVIYGILHDARSSDASCHVVKLQPCTDEYIHRCFPASKPGTVPLAVSRK